MSDLNDFTQNGFAMVPNLLDAATIETLLAALAGVRTTEAVKQRGGRAFGIGGCWTLCPPSVRWRKAMCCKDWSPR